MLLSVTWAALATGPAPQCLAAFPGNRLPSGARALSWGAQRNEVIPAPPPKEKRQIPRGPQAEQAPTSHGKLTQRVKEEERWG